ncbi:MAG: hypothetical protein ACI8TF_002649 [Paracoccaceae bacterium]|jgi:hypothetical protein
MSLGRFLHCLFLAKRPELKPPRRGELETFWGRGGRTTARSCAFDGGI